MDKQHSDSSYIRSIKNIRADIFANTQYQDSVYEQAIAYFKNRDLEQAAKTSILRELVDVERELANNNSPKREPQLLDKIYALQKKLKQEEDKLERQRLTRHNKLVETCYKIIDLVEGEDFDDTNKKTAKLLGALLLMSPNQERFRALENEKSKHLYKAALALRVTDQLVLDGDMHSQYVKDKLADGWNSERLDSFKGKAFTDYVQLPIVMAAVLQDVGRYHPDAQAILLGEDGNLNPYRQLPEEQRKQLLKINYRETLKYITQGIGAAKYVGNSRIQREEFNSAEQTKLKFIRTLLKSWVNPDHGIGNILKIPQIYTSVILSTKPTYDYGLLPNVYNVLIDSANNGTYNKATIKALLSITGKFPQGYGVTYISQDSDDEDQERYEYAIVTQLYPQDPQVPICRQATKNLQYSHTGINYEIGKDYNLFFPPARKNLLTVGEERLRDILKLLSSNYSEQEKLELIPKCWHPNDFFVVGKNQNLWNQRTTKKLGEDETEEHF